MIQIGTAGIGSGIDTLPEMEKAGIKVAEVEFVRNIYMTNEKAKLLNPIAKKHKVQLSIHAPYYINLNSEEKAKVTASKKRILDSCERGHHLGVNYIVFHAGYVGKMTREQTYENIKNNILDLQDKIKEKKYKVKLAPETTGKISVFGDLDETLDLAKQTKTAFCIDFSHLKARLLGKINYEDVIKKIKHYKHIHSHFSGIEWTDKGEKRHIPTNKKEAKLLLKLLKKHKVNINIINESPRTWEDTLMMNKLLNEI
ncbi:endonuclease IV [archaeon]|nr:endonuclease IV [archaeon]|tara:strand:- start:122 stop:889 length:768 start_codon:yes stop_codon:yes gene_type:complete